MNTHHCCENAAGDSRSERFAAQTEVGRWHPRTFARRCLDITGWMVPGAILALLPKCPACLAAYVAIGTGVWLSLSTATYLHASLVILCVALPLYLAMRGLCRFVVVRAALLRAKGQLAPIQGQETAP